MIYLSERKYNVVYVCVGGLMQKNDDCSGFVAFCKLAERGPG
jgi:hypothetical protein